MRSVTSGDEPARTVARWVNERDVQTMGPKLVPYIEELGGFAALSAERSPATTVPVFLLHGSHDNVIPYTETPQLEAYLRARGNARVTSLLTPLISHAEVGAAPSLADGPPALVVPGGFGTRSAMHDRDLTDLIADWHTTSTWTTLSLLPSPTSTRHRRVRTRCSASA